MNKRIVNILWTGGLDSSFRVIELSQMNVIIQPYYIEDSARKSKRYELNAISQISDIIRSHPKTKATLLDVKLIQMDDIPIDHRITQAFQELHSKYIIGHQYDLIARYALHNNIRFEMSLEKSDRSKAVNCIETECKLLPYIDGDYKVYRIDPNSSTDNGMCIFSNIDLPISLWNLTKVEEVARLKEMGHFNTVKHTWFCHFPVWGLPCGHCNPCQDSINEGLAFRVPQLGRILYYIYKPYFTIKCHLIK
ncbi:MAG: hypothetical protein K2G41_11070 [Duncaniella sp.]|uniref:hypothetical protein n=1 Tax=Duncaniella sp. TaxID=2518496 RepID=UPI0023C33A70|nr:hypothetical protein [Duncaniella sp.]MDE6091226.1 hypothetical protein [Duncaniella sp.]